MNIFVGIYRKKRISVPAFKRGLLLVVGERQIVAGSYVREGQAKINQRQKKEKRKT